MPIPSLVGAGTVEGCSTEAALDADDSWRVPSVNVSLVSVGQ
jgi:hypothetical protein